jgi:hypothetical protein
MRSTRGGLLWRALQLQVDEGVGVLLNQDAHR